MIYMGGNHVILTPLRQF